MSVKILDCCRLEFNRELTAELPAKIDPEHQKVVFTKPNGEIGLVLSRADLWNLLSTPEEENLKARGLSNQEICNGYWNTGYSYLRPDAANEVGSFELKCK